jgi:hypothetical protein
MLTIEGPLSQQLLGARIPAQDARQLKQILRKLIA